MRKNECVRLLSEKKNRTSDELMVCVCASIESVWNVFFFLCEEYAFERE